MNLFNYGTRPRLFKESMKRIKVKPKMESGSKTITQIEPVDSVTRLGYSWNVLVIKIITKGAQIFGDFLGYFEKQNFESKICCDFSWVTFGINGLHLFQRFGHTAFTFTIL